MKTFSLAILAVALLTPAIGLVAQPRTPAIAYVSALRISTESTEGKAGAKRLEALGVAKTTEVRAKQQALEATRSQLANSGGVFQGTKRADLQKQEEQQRLDLQNANQQAQTELQSLQRQLQAKLKQELNVILSDIAKRRSLQIVLNSDAAVMWAPDGSDITAEVIERLNALPQTEAK